MSEVLLRTLEMLRLIPKGARYLATADIHKKLVAAGYDVNIRTVQRDLQSLTDDGGLGLERHGASKPYGWRYAADAPVFEIPAMDVKTALTLKLTERLLSRVLPPETADRLRGHVQRADLVLKSVPNNKLAAWPQKVRVTSAGLPVRYPEVPSEILDVMTRALLEDRKFRCTYRNRNNGVKEHDVNPLALVYRDAFAFLVCTLGDMQGVVTLVPHRIVSAKLLSAARRVPPGFDIDAFMAAGGTGFLIDPAPLKLVALVHAKAAPTIEELPVAADQRLEKYDKERFLLEATVPNSLELQRWLLGFGDGIEVLAPSDLRDRMRSIHENLTARYARSSGVTARDGERAAAWAEPEAYQRRGHLWPA